MKGKGIIFTVLGVIVVLVLSFILLKDLSIFQSSELEEYEGEFTIYEEEADPNDKKIDPNQSKKGKTIYKGGPYKVGDLVYKDGIGVKVDKVGWKTNAIEIEEGDNIDYAIFELSIYNYNQTSYEIKADEVKLQYKGAENSTYYQPLDISGYDKWKFIEGSFQFGEINKTTLRKGYIFIPIEEEGKKNGAINVYINRVPIKFNY